MSVQDDKKTEGSGSSPSNRPASLDRRALLRRGVVAMPAILTLQSGAALARSSNLISAAPRGTTDGRGRTLCLDTNSVRPVGGRPGVFDMGPNHHAEVNILRDQKYYVEHPYRRDQEWDDHDTERDQDEEWDQDDNAYAQDYRNTIQDNFRERERGETHYDAGYVCRKGGNYWTKSRYRYRMVELPKNGVVLSTGAILSHADTIKGDFI